MHKQQILCFMSLPIVQNPVRYIVCRELLNTWKLPPVQEVHQVNVVKGWEGLDVWKFFLNLLSLSFCFCPLLETRKQSRWSSEMIYSFPSWFYATLKMLLYPLSAAFFYLIDSCFSLGGSCFVELDHCLCSATVINFIDWFTSSLKHGSQKRTLYWVQLSWVEWKISFAIQ